MNCDIFLELNNVIAHLACWTDPETHSKSHKEIILFIPGNPGLIGFYTKYLEHLHKATNLPVWIIGKDFHVLLFHYIIYSCKYNYFCTLQKYLEHNHKVMYKIIMTILSILDKTN